MQQLQGYGEEYINTLVGLRSKLIDLSDQHIHGAYEKKRVIDYGERLLSYCDAIDSASKESDTGENDP